MRKKLVILLTPIALAVFCAWHFHFFPFKNPYAQIPVKFNASRIPYTEIVIEGSKYLLKVDLGCNGALSIKSEILKKMGNPNIGKRFWYDIKGNEYESHKYLIPKMKMGRVQIKNATTDDGYTDRIGHIWGDGKTDEIVISGIIGKKLLGITNNLLLDFNHSVFFLLRKRNALKDLQKKGYFLENMFEIPFEEGVLHNSIEDNF